MIQAPTLISPKILPEAHEIKAKAMPLDDAALLEITDDRTRPVLALESFDATDSVDELLASVIEAGMINLGSLEKRGFE